MMGFHGPGVGRRIGQDTALGIDDGDPDLTFGGCPADEGFEVLTPLFPQQRLNLRRQDPSQTFKAGRLTGDPAGPDRLKGIDENQARQPGDDHQEGREDF